MEMKKETFVGITIIVALALIVGFYIYRDSRTGNSTENTATSTNLTSTSTQETIDTTPGYTIEPVPAQTLPPMPSLTRSITYPAYLTDVQKTALEKNINETIALVQKNPKDVEGWVSLGNNRKIVADYDGAIEIWKYASALAPKYVVPLQNIADTYHFYIKNYVQSEIFWKKAITLEPQNPDLYKGLFDLYTLSYKEKASLAETTLLEGIKQSSENIDLIVYLAEYYKNSGRKEDARTYYQKAVVQATKIGDTTRATLINAEIAAL
jgi:tetratricopeptide (TPR) repeat protein